MFGWLRKLFEDDYSVYHPGEQKIYHYWDGQKYVNADPLRLFKRLMDIAPELAVDIQVSTSSLAKDKDAIKASDKVAEKLYKIFDVKRVEEGGLTEAKMSELLDHFLLYCEIVKKNSPPLPTMPPSGARIFTSNGNPPTSNTSDSGSTAKPTSTAKPEPSPSEPASPSVSSTPAWNTGEPSLTAKPMP